MMQRTSYAPLTPEMVCRFDVDGEQLVCKRCGLRLKASLFPRGKPFVACVGSTSPIQLSQSDEPVSRGLGDMASDALGAIGITKERAQAVANKLGIRDCGCTKRQKWMNEAGQKWLGIGAPKQP